MRVKGRYRFSLQFSADSEDHIRIGELLERSGNRKSALIISALSEYLAAHPEVEESRGEPKLQSHRAYQRSELEKLIREEVGKQVSELQALGARTEKPPDVQKTLQDDSVDLMLDNLQLFS